MSNKNSFAETGLSYLIWISGILATKFYNRRTSQWTLKGISVNIWQKSILFKKMEDFAEVGGTEAIW